MTLAHIRRYYQVPADLGRIITFERAPGHTCRGTVVDSDGDRLIVEFETWRVVLDPTDSRILWHAEHRDPQPDPEHVPTQFGLSDREYAVLHLMSHGHTNIEIGAKLFIGPDTVKTHGRRLFDKLGAIDRAHAVRIAFEEGLLCAQPRRARMRRRNGQWRRGDKPA